jgi:hypothetical protein
MLPSLLRHCPNPKVHVGRNVRTLSSKTSLSRSYLYVPASSDRMLEKSMAIDSDVVIYDLEDSVSPIPEDKASARRRLSKFLHVRRSFSLSGQVVRRCIG